MRSDPRAQCAPGEQTSAQKRFYGKYRGVVTNNVDPLALGRILAVVPAIPGSLLSWALPCAPFTGPGVGQFCIPPLGANVWIEFEGGNPNFPIWSGGFWEELELPYAQALNPLAPASVKVLKTASSTVALDDTPDTGGLILEAAPPAVKEPATMAFSSDGVEIGCGASTVLISPEQGITLSVGEVSLALTLKGITLTAPTIAANAQDEVSINATRSVSIASATISVTGAVSVNGTLMVAGHPVLVA